MFSIVLNVRFTFLRPLAIIADAKSLAMESRIAGKCFVASIAQKKQE